MPDEHKEHATGVPASGIFWRVEGSLLNVSAVRPIAFFTWNAQSFSERWMRRLGVALSALVRPALYVTDRVLATRLLHALLRGISRDRLDLLGEEYFHYVLKPRLNQEAVACLRQVAEREGAVILVSQALDHVLRPLAHHLGVTYIVANRLEFRDGLATGRLRDPVIRPRGGLARLRSLKADGRVTCEELARDLGLAPEQIRQAIFPATREVDVPAAAARIVLFQESRRPERLSVRETLAGRHILLIGGTGFIGKVWLAKVLKDLPEIGRLYLLIRSHRTTSAERRFDALLEESPVFESLRERYGSNLRRYVRERVEVIPGDITQPDLGLAPETRARLQQTLDLVINSSGLTDFNPDLRDALAINVDGTLHVLDFLRGCQRAALLHLSTCYVVGYRDGYIPEVPVVNYTPRGAADFGAEREWQTLHALVREIEARAMSSEVTEELRRHALQKAGEAHSTDPSGLEERLRRYRWRWIRNHLIEAGMRRAQQWGWPNTYTFTKSLGESLLFALGADLPIAVVRPSIVESSLREPFRGWNEGVNTSAPISYLLGTYFRQLPSNQWKHLDIIPVDLVVRGMILIAAALCRRCHERVYHLATSMRNPCTMRRSIELTGLAHRKFYRAQKELEYRLRAFFDPIPVSKERYQRLSVPSQKALVRTLGRLSAPLPFVYPSLVRKERDLDRVEKLIELYEPFILHNEHVFEANHIELLHAALPPEEREAFGYDVTEIDWWEYWINIHIPALRRWSYPLIEGRPLEEPSRRTSRSWTASSMGAAAGPSGG
jgi:nucleoside-diphosphate-sugar epimerase/phosphoserine phosphatase